jgi:hypothetical protein
MSKVVTIIWMISYPAKLSNTPIWSNNNNIQYVPQFKTFQQLNHAQVVCLTETPELSSPDSLPCPSFC